MIKCKVCGALWDYKSYKFCPTCQMGGLSGQLVEDRVPHSWTYEVHVLVQPLNVSMREKVESVLPEFRWTANRNRVERSWQSSGSKNVTLIGTKAQVEQQIADQSTVYASEINRVLDVQVTITIGWKRHAPAWVPSDAINSFTPDDWCKNCGWSAARRGGELDKDEHCPKCAK